MKRGSGAGLWLKFQTDSTATNDVSQFVIRRSTDNVDILSISATSGNLTVPGTLSASGYNNTNWDTAYGWGDHASVGYITGFTNTNEFTTGATFNSGDGVLTFTRNNGGDTYTVDLDGRYLQLGGGTLTGDLTLSGVNPQINFNGTSDAGVDMAIKATPEGLDFYEPEDGNKIHFQILDDTGVNTAFGLQVEETYVKNTSIIL